MLCCPLLLPAVFPSIRVFSNESALRSRWPKYWSFSINTSNEYSGLISFRIDWFDLLVVQRTLKSLYLTHCIKNINISTYKHCKNINGTCYILFSFLILSLQLPMCISYLEHSLFLINHISVTQYPMWLMAAILDIVGLVNAAWPGGSRSHVHTHRTFPPVVLPPHAI